MALSPVRWPRKSSNSGCGQSFPLSRAAAALLQAGGYTCVLWNAIPRDWADPDGWVDTALAQLAQQSWTLMVLHDLPSGAMRHLDRFLGVLGVVREVPQEGVRVRRHGVLSFVGEGTSSSVTCGLEACTEKATGPLPAASPVASSLCSATTS